MLSQKRSLMPKESSRQTGLVPPAGSFIDRHPTASDEHHIVTESTDTVAMSSWTETKRKQTVSQIIV